MIGAIHSKHHTLEVIGQIWIQSPSLKCWERSVQQFFQSDHTPLCFELFCGFLMLQGKCPKYLNGPRLIFYSPAHLPVSFHTSLPLRILHPTHTGPLPVPGTHPASSPCGAPACVDASYKHSYSPLQHQSQFHPLILGKCHPPLIHSLCLGQVSKL